MFSKLSLVLAGVHASFDISLYQSYDNTFFGKLYVGSQKSQVDGLVFDTTVADSAIMDCDGEGLQAVDFFCQDQSKGHILPNEPSAVHSNSVTIRGKNYFDQICAGQDEGHCVKTFKFVLGSRLEADDFLGVGIVGLAMSQNNLVKAFSTKFVQLNFYDSDQSSIKFYQQNEADKYLQQFPAAHTHRFKSTDQKLWIIELQTAEIAGNSAIVGSINDVKGAIISSASIPIELPSGQFDFFLYQIQRQEPTAQFSGEYIKSGKSSCSSLRPKLPQMKFHFKGGQIVLPAESYTYEDEGSNGCLIAVKPSVKDNGLIVFGNILMKSFKVGLDYENQEIWLKPNGAGMIRAEAEIPATHEKKKGQPKIDDKKPHDNVPQKDTTIPEETTDSEAAVNDVKNQLFDYFGINWALDYFTIGCNAIFSFLKLLNVYFQWDKSLK